MIIPIPMWLPFIGALRPKSDRELLDEAQEKLRYTEAEVEDLHRTIDKQETVIGKTKTELSKLHREYRTLDKEHRVRRLATKQHINYLQHNQVQLDLFTSNQTKN